MKLKNVDIINSPDPDKIRLLGEVSYADSPSSEIYWFDYPSEYKEYISNSGNIWLVALLPLAVTKHESIHIQLPVDSVLLENMKKLQKIWCGWYPHLKEVNIEAASAVNPVQPKERHTASFFSGGVDAFYTLLAERKTGENIQDIITIHGFDIPIQHKKSFERMRKGFQDISQSLNKNLITAATNIRETLWRKTDWGYLSHGCALAAVALGLESRFKTVLIPSTGGYHDTNPWGSHVETDPLLSTSAVMFVHDEPVLRRVQKLERISSHPLVQQYLRVCWKERNEKNCCRCVKCYRTMATLDVLEKIENIKTFPIEQYNKDRIGSLYLSGHVEEEYFKEIRQLAESRQRYDVIKLVDQSFRRSKRITQPLKRAKMIKRFLHSKPLVWRWADVFEKMVYGDMIHD